MNDNEINIAIAEACGAKWQDVPPRPDSLYHPKRLLSFSTWEFDKPFCAPLPIPDPKTGDATSIPRYTEDLNAMHEVLKSLDSWDHGAIFDNHLFRVLHRRLKGEGVSTFEKIRASARELAEAFLKTKGLWRE